MGKPRSYRIILFFMVFVFSFYFIPMRVFAEEESIKDMKVKLEDITSKENEILKKLFAITQEIDKFEKDKIRITNEIDSLQIQINQLEREIKKNKIEYDRQLTLMEQVLSAYQRGGPATYLEILLKADDLSSFLKSINMLKDISHNEKELITSLNMGKKVLVSKKKLLSKDLKLFIKKKQIRQKTLCEKKQLKLELNNYLSSMQEEGAHYKEQLDRLEIMWDDCKVVFQDMVKEITGIISDGYFTIEDLNLSFGITQMEGELWDVTFNQKLKQHTNLPETIFIMEDQSVVIEIPEKRLSLKGNFIIKDKTAIQFKVEEGSFFGMRLEKESLNDLFHNDPLLFDFKEMTGDMLVIDFSLQEVESRKGKLGFKIKIEY